MCVVLLLVCVCGRLRALTSTREARERVDLMLEFATCGCAAVCLRCPQSPREHQLSQQLADKEDTIKHLQRSLSFLASKVVGRMSLQSPHVSTTSGRGEKARGSFQSSTYQDMCFQVRFVKRVLLLLNQFPGR